MDCPAGDDLAEETPVSGENGPGEPLAASAADPPGFQPNTEYWRREVASRVERYRTRRKASAPKYPSLHLPFDSAESQTQPVAGGVSEAAPVVDAVSVSGNALVRQNVVPQAEEKPRYSPIPHEWRRPLVEDAEPSKVIEFPRSAAIPVPQSELADPVVDRPRIVEAPEVVPAPPAMGGILMENAEGDKQASLDFPRQSASLGHRMLAALIDGFILLAAVGGFAAIFVWLNPELRLHPGLVSMPLLAGGLAGVAVLLWAVYVFLFVVYLGATPGLRVARLRLTAADGSPAGRGLRRWRVLASYLSAFSLGLGYAWSLLDEDGLCWHDRITRTHIEPVPRSE